MELLKFNRLGQWSLVQKDGIGPDSEHIGQPDADYNSYRTRAMEGDLPKDTGQRGKVHNVGNVRPPKQTSAPKMEGKVPTVIPSAQTDRNPSRSGIDT